MAEAEWDEYYKKHFDPDNAGYPEDEVDFLLTQWSH